MVALAAFSVPLAFGGEQSSTNHVQAVTNQPIRLKGLMSRTEVIRPDAPTVGKINSARLRMKPVRTPQSASGGPQTIEEAGDYLAKHVAMACPPAVCAEYDGIFYFSGGTTTAVETNFQSGFAIKKGKATIHLWQPSGASNP